MKLIKPVENVQDQVQHLTSKGDALWIFLLLLLLLFCLFAFRGVFTMFSPNLTCYVVDSALQTVLYHFSWQKMLRIRFGTPHLAMEKAQCMLGFFLCVCVCVCVCVVVVVFTFRCSP